MPDKRTEMSVEESGMDPGTAAWHTVDQGRGGQRDGHQSNSPVSQWGGLPAHGSGSGKQAVFPVCLGIQVGQ